jgi:hypothetical protein
MWASTTSRTSVWRMGEGKVSLKGGFFYRKKKKPSGENRKMSNYGGRAYDEKFVGGTWSNEPLKKA